MRIDRPSRFLLNLAAAAAVIGALQPVAAHAQLRVERFGLDALKPSTLVNTLDLADPYAAPRLATPAASTKALGSSGRWLGSAVQLDMPRDAGNGLYTRPKFIVGVPSSPLRGMLRSAGFEAERCMLPMLRARTKMSGDGDINGTLWLYARCTFH